VLTVCHLAGFITKEKNVVPFILNSLEAQEAIIGGQATGLAVLANSTVRLAKTIGPVRDFRDQNKELPVASIGIGHTRYALKNLLYAETNSTEKSHPFWDSKKQFVTMHNGTITNYQLFVHELEKKGYSFRSKSSYRNENDEEVVDYCDSEIFSFLLEEALKAGTTIKTAIREICRQFEGQFAFVILHPAYPETIFIANWAQPLFIGTNTESSFFTSFLEGFEPVEQILNRKFAPQKNALITLTPGKAVIETLLPERSPPAYEPEGVAFEALILKALRENHNDLGRIYYYFKTAYNELGLSEEQLTALDKQGFTFSPLIYATLQRLEQQGIIYRKKELVWEGGVSHTPRFRFYLKEG